MSIACQFLLFFFLKNFLLRFFLVIEIVQACSNTKAMVRTVVSVICLGTLEFSFSVKSKAQQRFFLLWNSQKMQTLTNKNRKNSIFWLVSLALHLYQSFNPCFDQSLITFWKVQIVEKMFKLLKTQTGLPKPKFETSNQIPRYTWQHWSWFSFSTSNPSSSNVWIYFGSKEGFFMPWSIWSPGVRNAW